MCVAVYLDINLVGPFDLNVPSIISGTENGKFIMEGGEITRNDWGVCGNGTIEMNNGAIYDNHRGIKIQDGVFTMNAGKISQNLKTGVELVRSTFIMNNGLISENVNSKGDAGGVYIGESSIFTMNNGNIANNSANNSGGVYVAVSEGILTTSIGNFIKSKTGGIIYVGERHQKTKQI